MRYLIQGMGALLSKFTWQIYSPEFCSLLSLGALFFTTTKGCKSWCHWVTSCKKGLWVKFMLVRCCNTESIYFPMIQRLKNIFQCLCLFWFSFCDIKTRIYFLMLHFCRLRGNFMILCTSSAKLYDLHFLSIHLLLNTLH